MDQKRTIEARNVQCDRMWVYESWPVSSVKDRESSKYEKRFTLIVETLVRPKTKWKREMASLH